MPTVGIDYGVTKVKIRDTELKVNIFDMSGHPWYFEVRNEFYKDAQAALLVFDVTNRLSFESLDTWLAEMQHELGNSHQLGETDFFVCANKVDSAKHTVDIIEARLWADQKGFKLFEVSAATGKGINQLFESVFTSLVDHNETDRPAIMSTPKIGYTKEQAEAILKVRSGKDNYEKLGLHRSATREDINKAYKKLAILLHPDKNVAPGSDDAFKSLVNARTSLLQNK